MLLRVEKDADGDKNFPINDYCAENFPIYHLTVTAYHIKYLADAGFLQTANGYIIDITPKGRDFLDTVRDEKSWWDIKEKIKPLKTVTINVLSEIAADVFKRNLLL
jgi:hypothetical protein